MKTTILLVIVCIIAFIAKTNAAEPFKYGNAASTYGPLHCTSSTCDVVPSCNRAGWAPQIAEYNKDADEGSEINIVYSYG